MSCGSSRFSPIQQNQGNCVGKTIAKIIAAQNERAANDCGHCGCRKSIQDLLSPGHTNNNNPTTIPFILYCGCDPFIADGVYQTDGGFMSIQSPVFRAICFEGNSNNCVKLELLAPVNSSGTITATSGNSVSDFFPAPPNNVVNFQSTGICITVDLNCFCSMTCLNAVTPLPKA